MDPYQILDLPKNFTLEQLKINFKRIAIKVHPDKGGSEQLFLLVTNSYKTLLNEYNRRVSNKEFYELRNDFKKESRSHDHRPKMAEKFDIEKFNKIFNDHKMEDVYDRGYQDWMNKEDVPQEAPQMKMKSFNIDVFNNRFDTSQVDTNNKYIMRYKEPEALYASKKINFTEIGQDDVDDFSGDNLTNKNLNFMDYRVAHTTSKIVDPTIINKVKTYKNVDELERARSQISFNMDERAMREYEVKLEKAKVKEHKRMKSMMERDEAIMKHYEKVNKLFLKKQ